MAASLAGRLEQLELQKTELIACLESWPEKQRSFVFAPGEWSATQILDHLVRSEAGIFATLRANVASPHPVSALDRLRGTGIIALFRSPTRVKVPESAQHILPAPEACFDEILRKWAEVRLGLRAFLADLPPAAAAGGLFQHPVSGWMTLATTLSFFDAHITHHWFQLKRIEEHWRTREGTPRSDLA